jgi:hypothetical protein
MTDNPTTPRGEEPRVESVGNEPVGEARSEPVVESVGDEPVGEATSEPTDEAPTVKVSHLTGSQPERPTEPTTEPTTELPVQPAAEAAPEGAAAREPDAQPAPETDWLPAPEPTVFAPAEQAAAPEEPATAAPAVVAAVPEPRAPRGPHLPAIVLGLACLLVAFVAIAQEVGNLTIDWGNVGPLGIVAAGAVLVVLGLVGLMVSRKS